MATSGRALMVDLRWQPSDEKGICGFVADYSNAITGHWKFVWSSIFWFGILSVQQIWKAEVLALTEWLFLTFSVISLACPIPACILCLTDCLLTWRQEFLLTVVCSDAGSGNGWCAIRCPRFSLGTRTSSESIPNTDCSSPGSTDLPCARSCLDGPWLVQQQAVPLKNVHRGHVKVASAFNFASLRKANRSNSHRYLLICPY